MTKFRKRPIVIEAFQLPGAGNFELDAFFNWATEVGFDNYESGKDETLIIETLEGAMTAQPGDWIIKEPFPTGDRNFYPCKPDIFEKTYEPVKKVAPTDLLQEAKEIVAKRHNKNYGSLNEFNHKADSKMWNQVAIEYSLLLERSKAEKGVYIDFAEINNISGCDAEYIKKWLVNKLPNH